MKRKKLKIKTKNIIQKEKWNWDYFNFKTSDSLRVPYCHC